MKYVFGIVVIFSALIAVIFAAPSGVGYQYKPNVNQLLNQFLPQNVKGYEISKLDCNQNGPIVKDSNGQIITVTYYNCGKNGNGQRGHQTTANQNVGGYLPRRNAVYY